MADITVPQKGGRKKGNGPRIDFTPMVDLGFILITFFIYTTTMAKPNTMELNMPSNEPTNSPTVFAEESTITLMPVKGHYVAYYNGAFTNKEQLRIVRIDGVRNLLMSRKKEVQALPATLSAEAHRLHVLIKPNDDCKYDDVVQLLDNMNIVDITYYALVDITNEEKALAENMLNNK